MERSLVIPDGAPGRLAGRRLVIEECPSGIFVTVDTIDRLDDAETTYVDFIVRSILGDEIADIEGKRMQRSQFLKMRQDELERN